LDKFQKILKRYWGYDEFRPLQMDIINSIEEGKDTLGLMPTGGGKSLTFQVPTMANDGLCVVITPLIALMKDQVQHLRNKGIQAAAIYTGLSYREIQNAINKSVYGELKFLYISPERLASSNFIIKLKQMNVSLFAIDEAHCISQWGYDFRPSYLKIAEVRDFFPETPVLALTATATPDVVDDIQDRLFFKNKNVYRKSFERENLTYVVRNTEDKEKQLIRILENIEGSAIVYVRNRRRTVEISDFLNKNNISSTYYHAGLSYYDRNKKQEEWMCNKSRVVVATNAFGMGIDKPDVRVVVHYDIPNNLEAYYQEAGRAGRDGLRSFAVLLYNKTDDGKLKKRIAETYPDKKNVLDCYVALGDFLQIAEGEGLDKAYAFDIAKFSKNFKLNIIQAFSSLKILQRCGYIELTDEVNNPTRLMFTVNRDQLYSYKPSTERLDLLIRLMLRSYTGIFTSFVGIDESFICDELSINKEQLYDNLKLLSRQKIIHLIPQLKTPYIMFTEPRLPISYVSLPKEVYKDRKANFVDKIDYMRYYASSNNRCRSSILVEYFGQEDGQDCGRCDVCLEKKKEYLSSSKELEIKEKLLSGLKTKSQESESLIDGLGERKEYVLEVLSMLLEDELVCYNSEGLLCVNEE